MSEINPAPGHAVPLLPLNIGIFAIFGLANVSL
jgi:hypothetical protein